MSLFFFFNGTWTRVDPMQIAIEGVPYLQVLSG